MWSIGKAFLSPLIGLAYGLMSMVFFGAIFAFLDASRSTLGDRYFLELFISTALIAHFVAIIAAIMYLWNVQRQVDLDATQPMIAIVVALAGILAFGIFFYMTFSWDVVTNIMNHGYFGMVAAALFLSFMSKTLLKA